jgi:hypothetical protein
MWKQPYPLLFSLENPMKRTLFLAGCSLAACSGGNSRGSAVAPLSLASSPVPKLSPIAPPANFPAILKKIGAVAVGGTSTGGVLYRADGTVGRLVKSVCDLAVSNKRAPADTTGSCAVMDDGSSVSSVTYGYADGPVYSPGGAFFAELDQIPYFDGVPVTAYVNNPPQPDTVYPAYVVWSNNATYPNGYEFVSIANPMPVLGYASWKVQFLNCAGPTASAVVGAATLAEGVIDNASLYSTSLANTANTMVTNWQGTASPPIVGIAVAFLYQLLIEVGVVRFGLLLASVGLLAVGVYAAIQCWRAS